MLNSPLSLSTQPKEILLRGNYHSFMRNKPQYALESVDNALRLIQLLRDQGRLRVSEAAAELGIARSTAHRLLAMLVYRGFAEQDQARGYLPGPALTTTTPLATDPQRLIVAAQPPMERLCERVEETVNLVVRVGTQVRFIGGVESAQVLHVGDRRGTVLPAAKASGGKVLLSELPDAELAQLYHVGTPEQALSSADWDALCAELRAIRRRGYGLNEQGTEAGVWAVGMAVHCGNGEAIGALSIALPTARYSRERLIGLVGELKVAVEAVERRLA